MIIFEGCDGTGKTTIAKEVAKLTGMQYIKDFIRENPFEEYLKIASNPHKNIIFDRFMYGEMVYPRVVKDGRFPLSSFKAASVEEKLLEQPTLFVHCHRLSADVAKTFRDRGEDFVFEKDIPFLLLAYCNLARTTQLPMLRYTMEETSQDEMITKIIEKYEQQISAYSHMGVQ